MLENLFLGVDPFLQAGNLKCQPSRLNTSKLCSSTWVGFINAQRGLVFFYHQDS